MYQVIDTPWNTTAYIPDIKSGGVETVIRYYNLKNSSRLPQKQITPSEAEALCSAGLALAVVYEQGGGAEGDITDLDAATGGRDARQALALANRLGQPKGSAIYFAVDHDYYHRSDLAKIKSYFEAIAGVLAGLYRVGVYGSGTVGATMQDAGYADLIWLAGATGWSGTQQVLATERWALFQSELDIADPVRHDGNTVSTAFPDFGQFTLEGGAAPLLV